MALWVAFRSTSWQNWAKPRLRRRWPAKGTPVVARHDATGGNAAAWASMTSFTQVRSVIRSALSTPARRLADQVGRTGRVHAQAGRVLRPEPGARRGAQPVRALLV